MEQKDTKKEEATFNGQTANQASVQSFYEKHASMSVIVKKTEKITTAIYMVTDFIPEVEPLRPQLRTLSLNLISGTRKLASRSSEPQYALADDVLSTIEESSVLITIATTIGLISEMNGRILGAELDKVKTEIKRLNSGMQTIATTHPGYANVILSEEMFAVEAPGFPALAVYDKGQDFNKGQNTNSNVFYKKEDHKSSHYEAVSRKNDLGIKIARRNDVLTIIKSKGSVSIKDIATILKDVSEKTLQRQLLALVQEGVIKKEGEKRWSTYKMI